MSEKKEEKTEMTKLKKDYKESCCKEDST